MLRELDEQYLLHIPKCWPIITVASDLTLYERLAVHLYDKTWDSTLEPGELTNELTFVVKRKCNACNYTGENEGIYM